jgi:hypothetical protein
MGNLLQYTDKSRTIDNKVNALLAEIQYDYQNGNIRTETEYYYRIKTMLSEFYKSLTKPTFKFRPAVSTPMSDEYNAMITESYNDMEYIIKDCEALEQFVSQSFSDAELSRNMMTNRLAYIEKQVSSIIESTATNQPIGMVVFTELFSDTTQTGNLLDKNACTVNTSDGILALRTSVRQTIDIADIEIDPEFSNGFPGNTHTVDTLNSELHFNGQDGLHINIRAAIDNNRDTWFEYEVFNIDDKVRQECNSLGFDYDEGVSWVTNDQFLRLKVILTLKSPETCSWITLTPYLSDVKGIKNCYIESCNVITTSNNVYKVAENVSFDDIMTYPFPPHAVQRVELVLVQNSKYLTKVGHFYYTMANTSSLSIFQDYDDTDKYARIDGKKPSVGVLGCKYDPTTQWIQYPKKRDEIPDDDYIKSVLFSLPESTIEKKAAQEMIDAYRYMIGIREIKLSGCLFMEYGEYVSKPFVTEEEITAISLDADEYIPGDDLEILRYYVSLNGGITWHQIYPTHRAYAGIYKYFVNNDSIENQISNGTDRRSQNLTIAGVANRIQVKIEMDRPKDMEYASPVVYGYKLKLATGGETIEY